MSRRAKPAAEGRRPPVAEKATAAIGALLFLGIVALLLVGAFGQHSSAAAIEVDASRVRRAGRAWVVDYVAHNRGGKTAADVMIEGRLVVDGREVARAESQLDFLPGGSRRHGALVFARDPAHGQLVLGVVGYRDP